jgi:predicted RNA polymerase sigma factor
MVAEMDTAGRAADQSAYQAIEAVWRIESARLIASLTRMLGDIGLAEDLAQDALVAALEQWPESGIPRNPGVWLMATAKHRAIDLFRREQRLERKQAELGYALLSRRVQDWQAVETALDDPVGDDWVRPALCEDALRLGRILAGLSPEESEVHGLVALMDIQASRLRACLGPQGRPVFTQKPLFTITPTIRGSERPYAADCQPKPGLKAISYFLPALN